MARIKAIIFDLDGVLIDAKEWHYEALNRALGLFGYSISRYEHLVTFDGLPTRSKLEMLSRERDLPTALHSFINELKQQYTREQIHAHCKPVFHHEYALRKLKTAGYKLAVASNAVPASVELMLDKANLTGYFDAILTNKDIERPKPAPDIYLRVFEKLGVTAAEALVVEDNEHGIRAARDSGAHLMVVAKPADVVIERIMANIARAEAITRT